MVAITTHNNDIKEIVRSIETFLQIRHEYDYFITTEKNNIIINFDNNTCKKNVLNSFLRVLLNSIDYEFNSVSIEEEILFNFIHKYRHANLQIKLLLK